VGTVGGASEEPGSGSRREPGLGADVETAGTDAPAPAWNRDTVSVPTAAAEGAREPRWSAEPKPDVRPQASRTGEAVPPRIPDWKAPSSTSTSTPDVHWERTNQVGFAPRPVHLSTGRGRGPRERSRLIAVLVVVACLVVAAVAIAISLHHSAPGTPGPTGSAISTSPATASVPTSPSTATAGSTPSTASTTAAPSTTTPSTTTPSTTTPTTQPTVQRTPQAAVSGALAATAAVRSGLSSLSGFPTPTNVAAVINPYAYALQLYESFLAASAVPAAAWSDKISTDTQMSEDIRFLDTINGLPSLRLGAYIIRFSSTVSHLQTSLSTLQTDLQSPSS
jgi:hypothetical protein